MSAKSSWSDIFWPDEMSKICYILHFLIHSPTPTYVHNISQVYCHYLIISLFFFSDDSFSKETRTIQAWSLIIWRMLWSLVMCVFALWTGSTEFAWEWTFTDAKVASQIFALLRHYNLKTTNHNKQTRHKTKKQIKKQIIKQESI